MLTINLVWDANALAAPQSFRDGVQAAANVLQAAIDDPITVNIAIGYGEYGLGTSSYQTLASGYSLGGINNSVMVSYPAFKAALVSNAASPDAAQAANALPNTATLNGTSTFYISTGLAKAFGAISPTDQGIDGYAGFPTSFTGTGLLDTAITEEVHALGLLYSPLSVVSYTSPGVHYFGNGNASTAYFSIDGGNTPLANYDVGFDDTLFKNQSSDPLNVPSNGSTLTALDKTELGAIGFDLTSTPTLPTPSLTPVASAPGSTVAITTQNVSVAEGATISALSMIKSVSAPSGDSVASYGFYDAGTGGGTFTLNNVVEPGHQWIYVLSTQLSQLQYVGTPSTGTETIFVEAYDSTASRFSSSGTVTATTTLPQSVIMISGFYMTILGRAADAGGLAGYVASFNAGVTYAQIQLSLASSGEAQSDIANAYLVELGRPADAGGLASYTNILANGGSLAGVKSSLGNSTEAQTDINTAYLAELGRAADTAGLATFMTVLAGGGSLASVKSTLGNSAEAQTAIANAYLAELGRAADQAGLATYKAMLAAGGSLAAVRSALAGSVEGQNGLVALYAAVLGRAADAPGLASFTAILAAGGSLAGVRSTLASSGEAQNDITGLYATVLGRTADVAGQASATSTLASNGSLATVRSNLATSVEARNDVSSLYTAVLGRAPDAGGLASFTTGLATNQSLAAVRPTLANSLEAQNDIANLYATVLGRAADAGGLATFTASLAISASMAGVRLTMANSVEAQNDVARLIQADTGSAPTATAVAAGQTQLAAGLSLADLNAQTLNLAGSPSMFLGLTGGTTTFAGTGAAVFGFGPGGFGQNTIVGFNPAKDVIQVSQTQFPTLASLQADLSQSSAGALITLDASDTITLRGIATASLLNADFRFV